MLFTRPCFLVARLRSKRNMKNIKHAIIGAATLLLVSAVHTPAIEGLKITIRCPDVVLSWPSIEGENYIVQWRETLNTNTPWVTLTNYLPAELGTNITTFTHSNRVDCPPGQVFGMMSMSSGGSAMMGLASPLTTTQRKQLAEAREIARIADLLEKCEKEGREPYEWELKNHPPLPPSPEEVREKILAARAARLAGGASLAYNAEASLNEPISLDGANDPQPEEAGGGASEPGTGFYQVVRDGVHVVSITNLTNGVLSGTIPVLIEAGNADLSTADTKGSLEFAALLIDGVKFSGEGVIGAPPAYPWQFEFDTCFLENGDHTFQVEVTWANPDSSEVNSQFLTRYSDAFTISVSNVIYYPEWEPLVGEADISAYLLKTVYIDEPWQIDITDTNGAHVQTLSGYATNGIIEVYWNLVDSNGVTRTNIAVDPEFNAVVTVSTGGASAAGGINAASGGGTATKITPPKKQPKKDFPDYGRWVIAYQDSFKFEYSENDEMLGSIYTFGNVADMHGGAIAYAPPPGATNDIGQTFPIRYQKTNHMDTNITFAAIAKDHNLLLQFITNSLSRNIYLYGHGSGSTMVGGFGSWRVKNALKHRYRFVFLDGCKTATGDWDKAFKINGPGVVPLSQYQKRGVRPAAFCAYKIDTLHSIGGPVVHGGVTYDHTIPWQIPGFITNFLFFWEFFNEGVRDAFNDAKNSLPPVGSTYIGDGLEIYGYDQLRIGQYNQATDWP